MFRHLLLFSVLLCALVRPLAGQQVHWTAGMRTVAADTCELVLTAKISAGWHLYDMGPYAAGGPYATEITVSAEADGVAPVGPVTPRSASIRHHDAVFNMEIGYFTDSAVFVQRVYCPVQAARLQADVSWMICNETVCMSPHDTLLTVVWGDAALLPVPAAVPAAVPAPPAARPAAGAVRTFSFDAIDAVEMTQQPPAGPDLPEPAASSRSGSRRLLLEALLWGLAALLTPCVFPMVPMTISLFLREEGNEAGKRLRAWLYGLFIVLIYTLPVAALALLGRWAGVRQLSAGSLNWLSTHWLPNVLFFVVFMLFALSFFGLFEIRLPYRWSNASAGRKNTLSLAGVFFMALTLVLVSFSCTGPIVGTVLIRSFAGEGWMPVLVMAVFSCTFALPFTLSALFPSWMNHWPHSGSWLGTVKVSMAFVELALGLKFLSVADQTYHWNLLPRPVYLSLWILTALLWGFYLLQPWTWSKQRPGLGRCLAGVLVMAFAAWLATGLAGAPLRVLAGYLPPQARPFAAVQRMDGVSVKYADKLSLPYGLPGYFDLQQAEAAARAAGKPLFIDFTGHGCVNCREMEARVWNDTEVLALLRDTYVVVALYVDDRTVADSADWVVLPDRTLKTIGRINAHTALTRYGINAEPAYLIQSPDGKVVSPVYGYSLDVESFRNFLLNGRRGI